MSNHNWRSIAYKVQLEFILTFLFHFPDMTRLTLFMYERILEYRYRRGGSSLTGVRTQDPLLSPPIDMSGNILAPVSV